MAMTATEQSTLQELLEGRNAAREKCREIMKGAAKDKEGNPQLTAEQRTEFDKWETEAQTKKSEYDTRLSDVNRKSRMEADDEDDENPAGGRVTERSSKGKGQDSALAPIKWNPTNMRHTQRVANIGGVRASAEYNAACKAALNGRRPDSAFKDFKQADYNAGVTMQSDVEEKGGYFIAPEQMVAGILKEVDDATFVQRLCRLFVVRDARNLGVRRRTRKVNSFQWGQELTDLGTRLDENLAYGKRQLSPHYIGGGIPVSRDLIRSAMIPIETEVQEELGIDLGEKLEDAYLYGDGNEKPLGVMTPSNEGISTARDVSYQATTNTFKFQTLIKGKYSLKPRYRNKARFMFHRDRMADIAMITDNQGQFIWQPSKIIGDPDTVLGLPADESEWMPDVAAASNYFGLLCDWSYYWIAFALELEMMRLEELRALTNEILYICRAKLDGMPMLEEAFVRFQYAAS